MNWFNSKWFDGGGWFEADWWQVVSEAVAASPVELVRLFYSVEYSVIESAAELERNYVSSDDLLRSSEKIERSFSGQGDKTTIISIGRNFVKKI